MNSGHEGYMAKDLSSLYQPGSRGKKWFKIKPAETLGLAIVAADRGSRIIISPCATKKAAKIS